MNPVKKIIVAISISALLISCSSEKEHWDIAKVNNDIISFDYYMEQYPNGQYIDSATQIIENLFVQKEQTQPPFIQKIIPPISEWDNVIIDSLSLQINISARQTKNREAQLELNSYKLIEDILNKIGIKIIPQDTDNNIKLIIDIKVEATGAYYKKLGYLYIGSKKTGKISLTKNGEIPIILPISFDPFIPPAISYAENLRESEIEKRNEPEDILDGVPGYEEIETFLFNTWGSGIVLWLDSRMRSELLNSAPELRKDYEGELSDVLKNNIIRACFSDQNRIKRKAMELFPLTHSDSKTALSVVLYDINKSIRFSQIPVPEIELKILSSYGISAIEAFPTLMLYAENRKKQDWSKDEKNLIFETLKSITGKAFKKNDLRIWKEWWFNNHGNYSS